LEFWRPACWSLLVVTAPVPAAPAVVTVVAAAAPAARPSRVAAAAPATWAVAAGALSCDEQCYADHQEGYDLIADLVIVYCGCTVGGDCEAECLTAADPACDDPPGTTGDACATCLMDAGTSGASCATTDAALSAECQANADCAALVTCVLSCP
jgi:hypothetical protein